MRDKKRRTCQEGVIMTGIILASVLCMILLLGIIVYVVIHGIKAVNLSFLTQETSLLHGTTGIAGNILNTLYLTMLTLLIVTPVGVGAAIYLNEYARPGRLVELIQFTTETLAGVPSIIYGLFGTVCFGISLGTGYSLLTGALTMTLMVLPLITRNTQEALKTVPEGYRLGAAGLGAGKWDTIRTVILPSAMPGILTGVILGVGRIVGESAALLYTAGSGYYLPHNFQQLADKLFASGGTLSVQMYLSMSKGEYTTAYGIALVLLVLVLAINLLTKLAAGALMKKGGATE